MTEDLNDEQIQHWLEIGADLPGQALPPTFTTGVMQALRGKKKRRKMILQISLSLGLIFCIGFAVSVDEINYVFSAVLESVIKYKWIAVFLVATVLAGFLIENHFLIRKRYE